MQKAMNNVFLDSHFKNSSIYKARELLAQGDEHVIFGGKQLFVQRCQGKVSAEDFQVRKLLPIYSIGESNQAGNRKFAILDNNKILFKPTKKVHVEIQLPTLRKNLARELGKLKALQDAKAIPITFQLDCTNIYLSYDDNVVNEVHSYRSKNGRIMAIDLNPNYVGYSIVDWTARDNWSLVTSGMFDLTHFSAKSKELKHLKWELKLLGTDGDERKQIIFGKLMHLNGQRDHETIEIAAKLSNIFRGFNCAVLGIEKLDIKSKDNFKGKSYNRLVINEWLRNCLVEQLEKRLGRIRAKVIKVVPDYSSFVGNLLHASLNLPDPVLSSIEINRRAFEFNAQYIEKTRRKEKVIMFPNFEAAKRLLAKPLEGFGIEVGHFENWKRLYGYVKNSKVKYRVTLASVQKSRGFSKVCIKGKVISYNFK